MRSRLSVILRSLRFGNIIKHKLCLNIHDLMLQVRVELGRICCKPMLSTVVFEDHAHKAEDNLRGIGKNST
jgi:hypothetical protein